jgi:acetylglutamate kinase
MKVDVVPALRKAAPYLRLFQGHTFVVKFGGEATRNIEDARGLLEQVGILQQLGMRIVVVHGGGPQATDLAKRLDAHSEFVDGRRVTNAGMLEAMILALHGEVRTLLLSAARELGVPAIGLSGIDAGLVTARKRAALKVDYGYVGDIVKIDSTVLSDLIDCGYLPIVSPLCADETGQVLNVNADTVASAIAVELGAAKLILVTGVPGILRDISDPGSLISELDLEELKMLSKAGSLKEGMLPKSSAIEMALTGGVKRIHVVSYEYPDSLLTEVFTNEGCGTLIVSNLKDLEGEESAN